jgi:hypothetical protein
MNIVDTVLHSPAASGLKQMAGRFGIGEDDVENVVRRTVPEIAGGLQRNATRPGGVDQIREMLSSGDKQRFAEDASALDRPEAESEGNGILDRLLGGQESRDAANRISSDTGVDGGIVQKLLPMIAAATMGALSKETDRGSKLQGDGNSDGGGLLGNLLGELGGSSGLGDLASKAKRLF